MVSAKPVGTVVLTAADVEAPGSVAINAFDAYTNKKLGASAIAVDAAGNSYKDLNALAPGAYEIVVSKSGYFSKRIPTSVAGGETTNFNVSLVKKKLGGSDIAVTLNWDDAMRDIDLHVMFRSNTTEICHVSFD
jgi:hypothetical protein